MKQKKQKQLARKQPGALNLGWQDWSRGLDDCVSAMERKGYAPPDLRIGRRLYSISCRRHDGNISVRLNEHEILITPTSVSKADLTPEFW